MLTLTKVLRAPLFKAAGFAFLLGAPDVFAVETLGTYGEWTAFTDGSGKGKYCYMVAAPRKVQLASRRGDIFAIITHWPGEKACDVVQIEIGYPLKVESDVDVVIDRQAWKLFTAGGNAWAYKTEEDKAMVAAMRKGITMVVKGISARGNKTSDEYSLFGVTKAHQAISKACSVRMM